MPTVTIYTTPYCPYCHAAKALLKKKGVDYTEIVASNDPDKKAEMVEKSGGRMTFPQIFIGDHHVGGSDDIHALDAAGTRHVPAAPSARSVALFPGQFPVFDRPEQPRWRQAYDARAL